MEATYIATCPECGTVIGMARESVEPCYRPAWEKQGLRVDRIEGEVDWRLQRPDPAECFRLGHIPSIAMSQPTHFARLDDSPM
jgi:hypothetical protein